MTNLELLLNKYVKFIGRDRCNFDFKFKLGLNIDNKHGLGLHFTKLKYMAKYKHHGKFVADVEIPNDADVVYCSDKLVPYYKEYVSNKIIIKNIRKIEDMKEWNIPEFCEYMVDKHPSLLQYVKCQTENMCWNAIKKDPCCIEYVNNKTDKMLEYIKTILPNNIYVINIKKTNLREKLVIIRKKPNIRAFKLLVCIFFSIGIFFSFAIKTHVTSKILCII